MASTTVTIKLDPQEHRTLVTELDHHRANLLVKVSDLKAAKVNSADKMRDRRTLTERAAAIAALLDSL